MLSPPLTDAERIYFDRIIDCKMVREAVQLGENRGRIDARMVELQAETASHASEPAVHEMPRLRPLKSSDYAF